MTIGTGNEVRNGIPRIAGVEPTKFSVNLNNYPVAVKRALKQLMCEAQTPRP